MLPCLTLTSLLLQDYGRSLQQLLAAGSSLSRKASFIITHCDYPIKTTYSLDDPIIDGKSIYSILVKSLVQPSYGKVYRQEAVEQCPVSADSVIPGSNVT